VRSAATLAGSSSARLIRDLRERLKLSQQKFATLLDVTRLTASRWQSGEAAPSAENFLVLAKLAQERGYFDLALKFWESAGVTIPILRALIPEFEKFARLHERHTFEPPADKEVVRLPLLDGTFFEGDHEAIKSRLSPLAIEALGNARARVAFPAESVPHPVATVVVRAPDNYMWPIFRKGDLVAVECPFDVQAQHPKIQRVGDEPIVAAFCKPLGSTMDGERGPLYLRRMLLSGLEVTNISLESELGLRIAAARATHLKFDLELSGIDFREYFHSETLKITGKVHGLPGRPDPEWSILGRVVASVSSHPGNPDGGESAGGENT